MKNTATKKARFDAGRKTMGAKPTRKIRRIKSDHEKTWRKTGKKKPRKIKFVCGERVGNKVGARRKNLLKKVHRSWKNRRKKFDFGAEKNVPCNRFYVFVAINVKAKEKRNTFSVKRLTMK